MPYTPVSQRSGTRKTSYTPAVQRTATTARKTTYTPVAKRTTPAPMPEKVLKPNDGGFVGAYARGLDKIMTPPDPEKVGKMDSSFKRTMAYLPSEIIRNLPFGVGAIVRDLQDNGAPEKVGVGDIAKGVLETGKGLVRYPVDAGLNLVPTPVSFEIPGIGQFTNRQYNSATRIANGEDPAVVMLEEGSGAIFDTLFLAGMVNKVAGPRHVTVAKGQLPPTSGTIKNPPKSFRLYEEPISVVPMTKQMSAKLMADTGLTPKTFNSTLPTYFRMKGKTNGVITGEVVQIKPSYLSVFYNKLKGNFSKVPPEQIKVVTTKETSVKALESAKPNVTPKPVPVPVPQVPIEAKPITPAPVPAPVAQTPVVQPPQAPAPVAPVEAPVTTTPPANVTPKYTSVAERNLTLAPSKARTGEEIINEAKQVTPNYTTKVKFPKNKEAEYVPSLVGKTEIKQLVRDVPEFKANPVLKVEFVTYKRPLDHGGFIDDTAKFLTFKSGKTSFKIKPEALGLNEERLTAGDEITIDIPALKVTGVQQMRVYNGGNVHASVGEFRDGTPLTLGAIENVKHMELPEIVDLARTLMGQVPKIRQKVSRGFEGGARGVFIPKGKGDIKLRADLFDPKVTTIEQAAKTLAHEIGHLIDYLPDHTMRRGNIYGRLGTLRGFMKDFLPEGGASRTNSAIYKELYEFSKFWRPFDEATASPGFLAYRKSGAEIYADFISGLLNDPALVQKMAPEAYNTFFKLLDKKPAVMNAYFELQATLSGERHTIIERRRHGVQQMFKEGDIKALEYEKALEGERKLRASKWIANFKFALVSNNIPMLDRIRKLEKQGIQIPMDDDPRYMLADRNYLSGLIKYELETYVQPTYKNLEKNGIDWHTFGEALFYERIIAGDRSTQANPRGITPAAASEMYLDLQTKLGTEKMEVLKHEAGEFRKWLRSITEQAYQEGLYKEDLYKKMTENPAYATFQVLDYIEEGMSAKIYQSIGTLKDITNPANASILKAVATIRAVERNKIFKKSVDIVLKPLGDVRPADRRFNGRAMEFKESRDKDFGLITFKRNGVTEGYYVDKYIAHSLNNDTVGRNNIIMNFFAFQGLRWVNSTIFRPLFIGYNPGFHAFNLIRDFQRYWTNMPGVSMIKAVGDYIKAMPVARARAFGIPSNPSEKQLWANKIVKELEKNKVFSITFTDFNLGADTDSTQLDLLLAKSGVFGEKPAENIIRKTLNWLQSVGNYIETLPKAAAARRMSKGDYSSLTPEQRDYIRKNIGSPDFLDKGFATPISNDVALFSNAIVQGYRSDYNVAFKNPKTRSGWWWKTAQLILLPKLLSFLATLGFFGKEVKDIMDGVSEYDQANYTIIPLGKDENNKSIYLRLPGAEAARFVGAIFWKGLQLANPEQKQSIGGRISNILSFMGGQAPNTSPGITMLDSIKDYIFGKNPYDSFRDRPVISQNVFEANNWKTHKAFLGYLFEQAGGGIFYRFSAQGTRPEKKSTSEEIVSMPFVSNILGRFIRVSDYGKKEYNDQIEAIDNMIQSRRRLSNTEFVNEYVQKAIDTSGDRRQIEEEMIRDRYPDGPRGADEVKVMKNLRDKFRLNFVVGISGPDIESLADADSNELKAALLKNMKTRMTPEEFNALRDTVIREKIVSAEVFNKLNNGIITP